MAEGERRWGWAIAMLLFVLGCSLIAGASEASASISEFGEEGSGAGQFVEPDGGAVDQTSGDVYVADRNNQRIDEFDGAGTFLRAWGWGVADGIAEAPQVCTTTCFAGLRGSGSGQFDRPEGVAVDSSTNPLDTSVGDVYVFDVENRRVEKFGPEGRFILMFGGDVDKTTGGGVCTVASGNTCGAGTEGTGPGQFGTINGTGREPGLFIAVDSLGTIYAGDVNRIEKFSPEGEYESEVPIPAAGKITALAVDSSGDVYVGAENVSGVQVYNASGTLINTLNSGGEPQTLALGSSGELFVDDGQDTDHHILEYDSAGNEVDSFDTGTAGGSRGIAFGDAAGVLYVLNQEAVRLVTPPSPGPLIEPASESASPVGTTTATLDATIEPEGRETTYHFEYGPTMSYGTGTPESAPIGASFEDQPASTAVTELQPATMYHFRVVATNAAGTIDGPDQTFTTLPPALIDSESAANVTSGTATLDAEINPLGLDTKYTFEYGQSTSYESRAPVPAGGIGSGMADVAVSQYLQGLASGAVYHYRVVATNALGTVAGADHTFATQPGGATPQLPDGRAWELVSPADKHGATIEAFNEGGAVIQASADGRAITYAANAPTEANPPGSLSPERVQVLSRRGDDGWASRDIATPHSAPSAEAEVGHESEYKLFSDDLSLGIVEAPGNTLLSPEASERTPYLRDDVTGGYLPLITAANVPAGTRFGGNPANAVNEALDFTGASPDLSHVVLASTVPLTSAPIPSSDSLYEWSSGKLQLVSLLATQPNGEPGEPAPAPSLGYHGKIVRHAISNDGSRVVWESEDHLYMRDASRGETIQLDAARGVPPLLGAGRAQFQTASDDGSKVFFTDLQQLTADAKPGENAPDLYEFEVTAGGAGRLTDLTVDHNAREHAGIQGVVLGSSEDGSYLYLVAKGVLSSAENGQGETAAAGADNLYLLHHDESGWTTTFIAGLSSEDENDWEAGPDHSKAVRLTSRVSPNGLWVAFMSDRSLTGYDNSDANSGKADEEVFLYDADTDRLVCASCNPSGERPAGMFDTGEIPRPLVDPVLAWPQRWLAGSIPGWTPDSLADALYQSRYLSDSGRLFFDSADALVPQDTNGKEDVYEYEPDGVGSCAREGGCVALISSGSSTEESVFLDASENGDDVFFLTTARLAPEDRDGSFDIYDAHVCSAAAPCVASSSTSVAPVCTSAESCRTTPPPRPTFEPPASMTFIGAGNLIQPTMSKPEPRRVKTCKLGFARKKARGRARCVKHKTNRSRHPARKGHSARKKRSTQAKG